MNFNVKEILDRYGIDYKPSGQQDELLFYCPFHAHSDERMGSSFINEETGVYNCFACGEGGNIIKFISKIESISEKDAYKLLASNFNNTQYDLENLKNRRLYHHNTNAAIAIKINQSILAKLPSLPLELKHRWLIVCNYMKMNKSNEKQLLTIYDEFNKEIHQYEQTSRCTESTRP